MAVRNFLILLAVAAVPALAARAAADTVHLQDGRKVEGTVVRIETDKLTIRTAAGVEEYTRDQVKFIEAERPGPDGKPRTVHLTFKPKPVQMPFEVESEHYITKTDVAENVAKNASHAMEELYAAYTDIFDIKVDPPKVKTEVLIYAKQEDFMKYASGLGKEPRPGTLGLYRMDLANGCAIITYKKQGDEFNTLSTLYHEATHQFVMMAMDNRPPPTWVNEGLAVYFESSFFQKDKLRMGIIPEKRLLAVQQRIKAGTHVALKDLLTHAPETFDGVCESEAWSLVYFLVKANDGAYAKRFGNYIKMLRDQKNPDEAFKECFPADLDKLEAAWKQFVLGLKAPKK